MAFGSRRFRSWNRPPVIHWTPSGFGERFEKWLAVWESRTMRCGGGGDEWYAPSCGRRLNNSLDQRRFIQGYATVFAVILGEMHGWHDDVIFRHALRCQAGHQRLQAAESAGHGHGPGARAGDTDGLRDANAVARLERGQRFHC